MTSPIAGVKVNGILKAEIDYYYLSNEKTTCKVLYQYPQVTDRDIKQYLKIKKPSVETTSSSTAKVSVNIHKRHKRHKRHKKQKRKQKHKKKDTSTNDVTEGAFDEITEGQD